MKPLISAEQWAALRALREGETPTFARLAAASRLNASYIRERASRDSWKKRSPAAGKALGEGPPASPEPTPLPAGPAQPAQLELADPAVLERLAAFAGNAADGHAVLLAEVEGVLAQAQAGRVEKARVDAVLAMIRMVERSEQFRRPAEAANKKTRSDDELAGLLARIDARIVELARAYAERLGRGECSDNAG